MFKFLRKMWHDRRGNTLAIAAACMPLFVGAAGLATDTIQWTLWKRQLQRAADSAAMAGVYDRTANGGETTNTDAAVTHDLSINRHTYYDLLDGQPDCSGACDIDYPEDTAFATDHVSVTIKIRQPLTFSSIFLSTAPTITATATAAAVTSGGDACIEALEKDPTKTGITNSGNATVDAPNCVLYSNSPSANSATAGGSSEVTAKAVAAVGGIAQSNNFHVGKYLPYSPALIDPFGPDGRNVTPNPDDMHCAGHWVTKGKSKTWVADALTSTTDVANATYLDSSGNVQTGANCFSSMSVGANTSLSIPDDFGPIYLNGGGVDLKGHFDCDGCSIVLTNKSTATDATIGDFSSNAQATNTIIAPTEGDFRGIAVYQDRRAKSGTPKINGGSGSLITGALYFPGTELWINGTGDATSMCAMFVARRVVFTGTAGIKLSSPSDEDCEGLGLPSNSSSTSIRLVA
jgi:Flp pilus assembly protein TadG